MAATDSTIQASGGDYTTIAAWHSAVPSSPSGLQRGLLAAEEFAVTSDTNLNGKNPSSTANGIVLTTQSGASFLDAVPFVGYYDTSKARWTTGTNYVSFIVNDPYTWIDGVQFSTTQTGTTDSTVQLGDATGVQALNCLAITRSTGYGAWLINSPAVAKNCIGIADSNGADEIFFIEYDAEAYNCIAICPSDQSPSGMIGFRRQSGTPLLVNCASFGCNTDYTASGWDSNSKNNASDGTGSPGSNPQDSLTYADQFTSTVNDFTIKSGSDLIDTGDTDAMNNPLDALGRTRDTGTDGDIGWLEGPLLLRDQKAFRYFNDDGTEATATAKATQNIDVSTARTTPFHLRVGMEADGNPDSESATLQYKEASDAATEWRDIS